jgi:hypothetical protein
MLRARKALSIVLKTLTAIEDLDKRGVWMKTIQIAALAAAFSAAYVCPAATLQYHSTGVFTEFTPDTPYTAPGQPFDVRFLIDSEPVPMIAYENGFTVATVITLKVGSRPELTEPGAVTFAGPGGFFNGGYDVLFRPTEGGTFEFGFGFGGEPLFTGPANDPVMKVGTFELAIANLTVTAVPEPASGTIAAAALGVLGLLRCRRHKAHRKRST